ncbi:MAG: hypothetical protein FWH36_01850 [Lentimicrobiaceae bacterium]|nr:hypothetical protein [Lentimicrobiaceae bacterium]
MDKLIRKIANISVAVLAVIAAGAGLYVAIKGKEFAKMHQGYLDVSLYITYILLIAILVVLVFFVIVQVFSGKKTMISALLLLAAGAAITLCSHFFASEKLSEVAMRVGVSESVYRWAGTGLIATYIVFGGVILAFLGSLIYIKIKK